MFDENSRAAAETDSPADDDVIGQGLEDEDDFDEDDLEEEDDDEEQED